MPVGCLPREQRVCCCCGSGATKKSLTAGMALAQVAASSLKCSHPFNQDYCDIGFSSLNIELGIG
jgi:hypothetical protein